MNADLLLAQFDRISDTPNAVMRLRRFILDSAVRGKLVPQDPSDEPASSLMNRINMEKVRLVKAGKIRKNKPHPPVPDFLPFNLPRGWEWARLGHLSQLVTSGSRDWASHYAEEGAIFIRMGNLSRGSYQLRLNNIQRVKPPRGTEGARTRLEAGDILISITGEVGLLGLVPFDFGEAYINQHTCIVRPMAEMHVRFLAELFRSPFAQDQFNAPQRGIKNSFRLTDVTEFLVPLPPLAEQHRIVAKIDELMALCDRLEAERKEREARRDRLTTASLIRLDRPHPATFPADARFSLRNFAALTARPDQISQIRQTILNLAVSGRLVPQYPEDEPATEFVKRLRIAKLALLNSNGIKPKALKPTVSNVPYSIPASWTWVRIDDCFLVSGGIQKTPGRAPGNNSFPYVGVSNVYRGRIDLSKIGQFQLLDGELEKFRLIRGDILVVEGNGSEGEIGRCAVWNDEINDCVHQNHIIRCRPFQIEIVPYVLRYLNSVYGIKAMRELAVTTSGLFNLSVGKIRTVLVPLPPLSEQERIVIKFDELTALCNQLEASITAAGTTRSRLLEAVLHDALAPAAEPTRVAAE